MDPSLVEIKVLEFFKNFNRAYNSFLFYDNKLFDYDIKVLAKL